MLKNQSKYDIDGNLIVDVKPLEEIIALAESLATDTGRTLLSPAIRTYIRKVLEEQEAYGNVTIFEDGR